MGHAIDERVRSTILALPERAWRPAINADGQPGEVLDAGALDHISPLQIRGEIPVARPSTPTSAPAPGWADRLVGTTVEVEAIVPVA